jgi:hypothetical protein
MCSGQDRQAQHDAHASAITRFTALAVTTTRVDDHDGDGRPRDAEDD